MSVLHLTSKGHQESSSDNLLIDFPRCQSFTGPPTTSEKLLEQFTNLLSYYIVGSETSSSVSCAAVQDSPFVCATVQDSPFGCAAVQDSLVGCATVQDSPILLCNSLPPNWPVFSTEVLAISLTLKNTCFTFESQQIH